ncbi:hypothetical protein J2S15_000703 [Breznakia pachnodae]|uniref:Uncharacterized protein n=1 Tax=Breznakia pachnodae TaxID=265178 RepID=A0ABU0DZA9_9FIRM|nr:hypothetical protein [Breznakia pachnodae]
MLQKVNSNLDRMLGRMAQERLFYFVKLYIIMKDVLII